MKRPFLICFVLLFLIILVQPNQVKANENKEHSYIPVLYYHHFMEGVNTSTIIDPERFRNHLLYLKDLGYETITETDLLLFLKEGKKLPAKPILITIDDGYLSTYTQAFPILKELEMKATVYVVVDWRTSEGRRLLYPHFNWDQAREMVASGFIDIQSHTFNSHIYMKNRFGRRVPAITNKIWNREIKVEESQEAYEKRILSDFIKSKEMIEKEIGNKVISLALPYGVYNDDVLRLAKEAGYELVLTTNGGVVYPGETPFEIQRIPGSNKLNGSEIENTIRYYAAKERPVNRTYLTINNEIRDIGLVVREGVRYLPLREISDILGLRLGWNSEEKSILVQGGNINASVSITSSKGLIGEEEVELKHRPILVKGKTYVSIDLLSNLLGLEVIEEENWLGSFNHIAINKPKDN